MRTVYAYCYIGDASELDEATIEAASARALALSADCRAVNPTDYGLASDQARPFVFVTQDTPNATPTVIPDDQGQATIAEVQAAQQAATAAEQAQASGLETITANLQSAVASLAPGLSQASTDAATCASSTTDVAPILGRVVNDLATVATALAGVLAILEIIEASEVPTT